LRDRGNDAALESIKTTASYLAEGIANLTHGLSPEVIVVGGQIAGAWSIVEPILKEQIKSKYLLPSVFFRNKTSQRSTTQSVWCDSDSLATCFVPEQSKETSLRLSLAEGRKATAAGLERRSNCLDGSITVVLFQLCPNGD